MSYELLKDVLEHSRSDGTDRTVLMVLAHYGVTGSRTAWTHIETLMSDCRVSRSSVYRALARLERSGEIQRVDRQQRCRALTYRIRDYAAADGRDIQAPLMAAVPDPQPQLSPTGATSEVAATSQLSPTSATSRGGLKGEGTREPEDPPPCPPPPGAGGEVQDSGIDGWEAFLASLEASRPSAFLWLRSLRPAGRDRDGAVLLSGPGDLAWIQQRFGPLLARAGPYRVLETPIRAGRGRARRRRTRRAA